MSPVTKRGSQFCDFSNTLFDQNSAVLAVPVTDRGDTQMTNESTKDITTNRLYWPRHKSSEKNKFESHEWLKNYGDLKLEHLQDIFPKLM